MLLFCFVCFCFCSHIRLYPQLPESAISLALALSLAAEVWPDINTALWTCPEHPVTHTDKAAVNCTRNPVQHVQVQFGKMPAPGRCSSLTSCFRRACSFFARCSTCSSLSSSDYSSILFRIVLKIWSGIRAGTGFSDCSSSSFSRARLSLLQAAGICFA